MGYYENSRGEIVIIERQDNGSYDVRVEGGEITNYGEDIAEHVYNDFDLHGQTLYDDADIGSDPDQQ
jgi:hypothetical protein